MAEVYRATDTKLARTVAVKVILPEHARDPHFVERFLREGRLVASLDHPNILPVYDFADEGGSVWLVMPFMDGGTLRDRMTGGPVPLAKAVGWIRQLAEGLDAAHAAGVLHRDVKPANVLVGRGERLALADFGIAKMLEAGKGLTATGVVVGTPVYMAPEQAQGLPATSASDRYALAVLAYELLSGRPPFDGESALALLHQHVSTPAPALSTKVVGLPRGLDAVFRAALSKEPIERPATCRELADALGEFEAAGPGIGSRVPAPVSRPTAQQTAATILQSSRPPSVAVGTPPPSLTTAATVATPSPAPASRRALVLAGVAAALALVAFFVWSKTRPVAAPAPLTLTPAVVRAVPTSVPVPATATPAPVVQARQEEPELTLDLGNPLSEAHRRLDPAAAGRRPTREDFAFALAAAQKALAENSRSQDARFLSAFSKSGLAYLDGREPEAVKELAAAFLEGRGLGNREARRFWFLQREQVISEGDRAWLLAVALGDPRKTAGALLEKGIAEHPQEARLYLGRAVLDRMDGKDGAALADARTAYENASRPGVRCAAAEIAAEELVKSGENAEALTWLRRAVAEAPSEIRGHLAMRAANVARTRLSDEKAALEFLGVACSAGYAEACRETGGGPASATSEERPRLRPLRRARGGLSNR